jgi:iron complex outermembrane receptor protein
MPLFSLRTRRRAAAIGLAAGTLLPLRAQPVVQTDPFVVAEAPLTADAAGTTRLQIPDTAPVAQRSLGVVADNIANLHLDASGAGAFGALVSLRGLSNTPYFSEPSVAVYFDDLPLGGGFTFPTDLVGFAAIDVSRGAQPAAVGRNAEAGVITFSSQLPGAVAGGELRFGAGNYQSRFVAAEVRTARGQTADATVAAAFSRRDGYIENTRLHRPGDEQQHSSAAARVRARPTATTEVTLQLLANQLRDGSQPLVPVGGPLFSVARDREGRTDSNFFGAALKLAADTSLGRLSATTSRTHWTLDPYDNQLVLPPALDSHLTQRQSAWNEEIRIASASHATVPWHVGAWYSDLETDGAVNRAIPGLFPIEGSDYTLNTRTTALFGEATVPASSGWRFTGALRAEAATRHFDRAQQVPFPAAFRASARYDALLPKLTAAFALGPASNVALSAGWGARPGGWSAYTENPALATFRPERSAHLEFGIDTTTADRRLRVAARVFDIEIRDYQIERSFTPADYLVVNAPRARSRGAEIEAAWRMLPGLTVSGTLGVADVRLREYADPFTGRTYVGNRAPYAPDVDLHLRALYRTRRGWFAAADLTAIGRVYFDETEDPQTAAPAHRTANAQIGYLTSRWRIAVAVENLDDAHYATLVIPGIGHQVPGAPRTYSLEAALIW